MGAQMISNEILLKYLDQKLILLTRISDITKQIEVQSRQDDIQLDNLPDQRQVYIDRLKKCEQMINESLVPLSGEEKDRRKKILSGNFPKDECSDEEAKLLDYAMQCQNVLHRTLAMDVEARRLLQKECDRLQNLLHTARKTKRTYSGKS